MRYAVITVLHQWAAGSGEQKNAGQTEGNYGSRLEWNKKNLRDTDVMLNQ